MPRRSTESGRSGRGTKRSRGRSPAEDNPVARRRIHPDILAPGDVRMRVDPGGTSLQIERTDVSAEESANSSWVVTSPNGGITGQGTTELIRRQLDVLDAFAPDAAFQFAIQRPVPRPRGAVIDNSEEDSELAQPPPASSRHQSLLSQPAPNSAESRRVSSRQSLSNQLPNSTASSPA